MNNTAVFSIKMKKEEIAAISEAAAKKGESRNHFARMALLKAARKIMKFQSEIISG